MKMKTKNIIYAILAAMLIIAMPASSMAQTKTVGDKVTIDGNVELDKTVHDFGDILYGSGPVSCKFTIKNISSSPMAIYDVASSCGCTAVDWTKQPIQPGKTGVINATFDNEDGPHPFDKRLTVYFSNVKKPVVLRLRGTAYSKKLPLSEAYPIHLGNLGLKEKEIKTRQYVPGQPEKRCHNGCEHRQIAHQSGL